MERILSRELLGMNTRVAFVHLCVYVVWAELRKELTAAGKEGRRQV